MTDWKIVDEHGEDIMTAESIAAMADMQRTTPRLFARKEAKLLTNGDDVIARAVPAT